MNQIEDSNENNKMKFELVHRLFNISYIDTWQSLEPCDILMVCGDTDRGYFFQGKVYAQLIDSMGDLFRQNGLTTRTLAHRLSQYTGRKGYNEPISMNRTLLRFAIGQRVVRVFKGPFAGQHWRYTLETQFWQKILEKYRPKAVIAIQPDAGLCRAGHLLDVKVFDLQHGVISDTEDNPYYWAENLTRREPTDLPYGFLCWDKASAEMLFPIAAKKGYIVRVIGNPWFTRFIAADEQDELVKEEKARFTNFDRGLPIILVTLQYNMAEYARDYIRNGVMADCMEDTIRETSEHYHWCIRLHPSQVKGIDPINVQKYLQVQFNKLKNIDWVITSKAALPAMLSHANLHITHYSSATIEAAWMGVRTGLLDPHIRPGGKHADFFASERAMHLAETLPLKVPDIKRFIIAALENGKSEKQLEDHNELDSFIDDVKTGKV